jgi:hypothetical protein
MNSAAVINSNEAFEPTTDVISSPLVPASLQAPRVVQPAVHNPSIPEISVVHTPTAFAPGLRMEPRVVQLVVPHPSVQELRVGAGGANSRCTRTKGGVPYLGDC